MATEGLVNESPFAAQELFLADEDGRDLLAVVVKATYAIRPGEPLALAEEQVAVDLAGTYYGDPAESSMRFEPEVAFAKPSTDVVLVGHAYPDRAGARQVDVGFQVGPVQKTIRVFGDRHWTSTLGFYKISEPQPFERVPLVWERAFGGWDRTAPDERQHRVEQRNPVGVGYRKKVQVAFVEQTALPNLEDPRKLITAPGDTPPPAGVGFIGPHWSPRLGYAGTYDETWQQTRMPLLPIDFDRRFFNAAPPGQITGRYLQGNESVVIANAASVPWLSFSLPTEPPPHVTVVRHRAADRPLEPHLDTVILDTDAMQVLLLWRAHLLIPAGPHAVTAIHVEPHAQSVHAAPDTALIPAA
ncbi:MAG: DUF2169 domain-containing protein [Bacteroidota bacterium]